MILNLMLKCLKSTFIIYFKKSDIKILFKILNSIWKRIHKWKYWDAPMEILNWPVVTDSVESVHSRVKSKQKA